MTSPIRTERHGDVLVIISDSPPVNALGAAVRTGLEAAVKEGVADASVAASHGTALGGGCEVALACHYRVAVPSAKIGVPEVKLGLLPGAGGTQRLPRLVGIRQALEMTAKGDPISAKQAEAAGLVDKVVGEDSLAADAAAFAGEIAGKRPIPRTSEKTVAADPDAVAAFKKENAKRFRGFDAPAANIACVEKAADGSSFAEGIAFERQEFMKLMLGVQSAAQRHLFFAERQAAKIDGIAPGIALRPVRTVGVIGAGTMGGGIAMTFLSAGIPVTVVEMAQEALDRGTATIRKNYEASAAKGRLEPRQVTAAMDALTPALDFAALADCDLVIEAAYEEMAVKREIFARLDAIAKPGAILASNTSYLDVNEIAAATRRPGDVLGMHFFSPANVMKLLEVVRGATTADDVLATVMALAKTIRKVAVVAGVCDGFIGNRMLKPRQSEAMKLLMEGATPERIDRVHVAFGMPMGPFQMSDLAGVDIGWHRDPTRIENIRDALAAEGRWGQKTHKGFYDYDERRNPAPSPRVAEIIADFRARSNGATREITDQEIVEKTLYTMVNEGALILEEGMAQRASDIDVVWIYGYGWPAYRGGPMFWADTEGLQKIVGGLEKHGFAVAESLADRAARGGRFI